MKFVNHTNFDWTFVQFNYDGLLRKIEQFNEMSDKSSITSCKICTASSLQQKQWYLLVIWNYFY